METEHPLPTESRPTAAPTNPPAIHTPDQRLRVFVSSTLDELAPERAAAREAISQLRQTPVLFESGARPYPPRELYRALLEESLVLVRVVGEQTAHSWVLCLLARLLFVSQSDLAQARSLAEESLALLREAGNRWTTAYLLTLLGQIILRQGDEAQARALAEESVAILKEIGDRSATAEALLGFARVLVVQGDLDAARRLFLESLAILRKIGNKDSTAACLECLAAVLAAQGAPAEAARLWGTAKAIREAIGAPMLPIDRADYERAVAAARTELGEEAFAKAWVEGSTLLLERVLDEVLR